MANVVNGYSIFLMIELAKCEGLITHEQEYDTTWNEGCRLYEKFESSEFDDDNKGEYECIQEFLAKEIEELEYSINEKSPKDELDLNIQGLSASENGDGRLANTIWSLIELKGYERLDYTMSLLQMKVKFKTLN